MRIITLAIAFLICTNAQAQIIRAEPFYVAPEAGVTNLLLDDYPGAAVAYSLRKLDKDYTGSAIRVRRSSDNTEQDIGFVNNYLDTAAMKTFVGANNGFVVTWYNQADSSGVFGVGNATQTTAANQPQIITTGSINYIGSDVAIRFDGSNDFMQINTVFPTLTAFLTAFVGNINSGTTGYRGIISTQHNNPVNGMMMLSNLLATDRWGTYSAANSKQAATTDVRGLAQVLLNMESANSDSGTFYFNNSSDGIFTSTDGQTRSSIGSGADNQTHNGSFNEIIFYITDQGSNRAGINSNINSFYSIY